MKCIERYDGDETEIKHCCQIMKDKLLDYRCMIDYDTEEREYFIPATWPHGGGFRIYYCPWCSTKVFEKEKVGENKF